MPIHLNYQGTICKKCGADFIAYKEKNPCPKCGQPADESFDFVNATVATMKDHKQLYGNYFPEAWFSGSTADLIQGIIFEFFDNFEIEKPKDFAAFILEQLATAEWDEGQEYLTGQVQEIALEVYEEYRQDPDFKGDNLKEKPINPKLKDTKLSQPIIPAELGEEDMREI